MFWIIFSAHDFSSFSDRRITDMTSILKNLKYCVRDIDGFRKSGKVRACLTPASANA